MYLAEQRGVRKLGPATLKLGCTENHEDRDKSRV